MSNHLPLDLPFKGEYARQGTGERLNGFFDRLQRSGYVGDGHEVIRDQADLPDPSNGTISLETGTVYAPKGFVTTDTPFDLQAGQPAPIVGRHGSTDGFIYTGGGTMFQGAGPHMARDCYFHAPGGTMYGLSAPNTTEMLVESCAFSDAAGIGSIVSLGTVDGYRVPTWKGCNFEDFAGGFTFTGSPDKIFFRGCPMRSVSAPNATILQFGANLNVDIVDMPNNYVKDVQSDTEVVNVDPSATINTIFQYRGNTHDSTVQESNILTGAAGVDQVGYRVSDSFPLSNSKSFADYTLDANSTATITTQASDKTDGDAYVRVPGTTTTGGLARFTHTDNLATYIGKRDRIANMTATLSLGTGTSDEVAAAFFKNASLVSGPPSRVQMNQQGGGVAKALTITAIEDSTTTDDEFDVRVANLGSTTDIDIGELNAKITT